MFDIRPDVVNDPENPGKKMKDYFKAAGKHLLVNGAKLLEDMMNYDKDNISHHIIQQIEPFYNDPQFTPEIVEKASRACKAMCMWARAMYKYHQVTLTVEPKKILLRNAQVRLIITCTLHDLQHHLLKLHRLIYPYCCRVPNQPPSIFTFSPSLSSFLFSLILPSLLSLSLPSSSHTFPAINLTHLPSLHHFTSSLLSSPLLFFKASLDATLSLLKAAQDTLSNAEKQISILEASFAEASAKREQLAYDVEQCRVRLVRAQSLMGGLASEKIRWTDTYQSLSSTYENLVGDALVSAGSIGNSACNITYLFSAQLIPFVCLSSFFVTLLSPSSYFTPHSFFILFNCVASFFVLL